MNPLFERIEVKTIDDLPKKEGLYVIKLFNGGIREYIYFNIDYNIKLWLQKVIWYYQPVSEEEVQKELCIYPRIKKNA